MATTEDEAHIQNNRVESIEAGRKIAEGLYHNEDRISTIKPVPVSTHNAQERNTTLSSGKRKLDDTDLEPLSAARKLHIAGKENHKKRSEPEMTDRYSCLTRHHMRHECWALSISASGSPEVLRERLRLYDATRAQISTSRKPVKDNDTSYAPSNAEPLDKYSHMLWKELLRECEKRSIPGGSAKRDLRRCLRLYDSARALGLTPEESVEAQRANFLHCMDEHPRSVNTWGSTEENTVGAALEEVGEGHTLGRASQESVVDDAQTPTSMEYSDDDAYSSTSSQASGEKNVDSSSATTQDSTQDGGTSDICLGPVATPNYAGMCLFKLRSLCRSRSIKQHGFSARQLRIALATYDKSSTEQANNAKVESAEPRIAPYPSPTSLTYIDLDLSSQDGDTSEVGASAAQLRKEPVSVHLWPVNQGRPTPVSIHDQVETRQGGSTERVSAATSPDKDSNVSSYSPLRVSTSLKEVESKSSHRWTPYDEHPMSLQPPLISLWQTIKNTKSGASEGAHQGTLMNTKPLSALAFRVAEKEELFNAKYATCPKWICCCETPGYNVRQKQPADFSGNCLYHISKLAQRGTSIIKEFQEYLTTQQTLDRMNSCLCQKPAVDFPEHQVTITQGGFILAQIWREQLTRRQSLTVSGPDIAAYRRKGILEVMFNILEDFMISSRQQHRPLVLWARMEAMAWFINTLLTSSEWRYFQDWRRPRRYIMLFGIALLTTIEALLQQNLFKDEEPKVPNLGLVLALFIQSTEDSTSGAWDPFRREDTYKSPFDNEICVNNENGWAAEVVSLADQHGVRINGVQSIEFLAARWRLRKRSFQAIRDPAKEEQYVVLLNRETTPPSEATLASIAAKGRETPPKRGTEQQVKVRAFRTFICVARSAVEVDRWFIYFSLLTCVAI